MRSKSDFQEREVKFVKIPWWKKFRGKCKSGDAHLLWGGKKNQNAKHESIENSFCSTCTFVKGLAYRCMYNTFGNMCK